MKNISLALKRTILAMAFLGMVTIITGCRNTADGVGQDVENAGEKIQETVD